MSRTAWSLFDDAQIWSTENGTTTIVAGNDGTKRNVKETESLLLIATLRPSTNISHRTDARTVKQEQTEGNNCAENRVINFGMEIMQIHCPISWSKYVLSGSKRKVLVLFGFRSACVYLGNKIIRVLALNDDDGASRRSDASSRHVHRNFSRTQIFAASFT